MRQVHMLLPNAKQYEWMDLFTLLMQAGWAAHYAIFSISGAGKANHDVHALNSMQCYIFCMIRSYFCSMKMVKETIAQHL